jgi:hypothetical protein
MYIHLIFHATTCCELMASSGSARENGKAESVQQCTAHFIWRPESVITVFIVLLANVIELLH